MKHQLQTIRAELTALHGIVGDLSEALTALSELERMAGEPIGWWNGKETVWLEHELNGYPPPADATIPVYTIPPAQQPQAEVGNSGFDHKTAADFLSGKTVSDEAVRKFVQASRWAHDDRASLQSMLLSVRNELASREAEIALLKKELMEAEAAPQQAEAVPSDVVRDAERYRWLRDASVPPHNFYISVPDEFHGVKYQPGEVDAYIDAAIAAQGEKP